jgi:hypothetical protein
LNTGPGCVLSQPSQRGWRFRRSELWHKACLKSRPAELLRCIPNQDTFWDKRRSKDVHDLRLQKESLKWPQRGIAAVTLVNLHHQRMIQKQRKSSSRNHQPSCSSRVGRLNRWGDDLVSCPVRDLSFSFLRPFRPEADKGSSSMMASCQPSLPFMALISVYS